MMAEQITNNASDFQPPTQNPQSGVQGNLQPGTSTLQPTPGQTDLNQQILPSVNNLKVADNGIAQTAQNNPTPTKKHSPVKQIFSVLGLIELAVITIAIITLIKRHYKKTPEPAEIKTPKRKIQKKKIKKTTKKRRR